MPDKEHVQNNPEINRRIFVRPSVGTIIDTYTDGTRLVRWDDGTLSHVTKDFLDDWCMFEDGR